MASSNDIPFHQRFPKVKQTHNPIVSILSLLFGFCSVFSQILFNIITNNNYRVEWTFGYHFFVETMKAVLGKVFASDINSIQTTMTRTSPVPKGAIVRQDSFDSSKEAIDFLKSKVNEWPEHATDIYNAHGEWIYDSSCENSEKVVLFLHGGIYIVGCAEASRSGSYNLSKASGAKVFGILILKRSQLQASTAKSIPMCINRCHFGLPIFT